MLFWLQQDPIVVEVVRQPPVSPQITYGEVILNAVGLIGLMILLSVLAGLVAGGIIIFIKRRLAASAPPTDPGHARLRI